MVKYAALTLAILLSGCAGVQSVTSEQENVCYSPEDVMGATQIMFPGAVQVLSLQGSKASMIREAFTEFNIPVPFYADTLNVLSLNTKAYHVNFYLDNCLQTTIPAQPDIMRVISAILNEQRRNSV